MTWPYSDFLDLQALISFQADFRFNRVNLVAADPPHGCQPLVNHLQVRDAIVLVERGYVSFSVCLSFAQAVILFYHLNSFP